MAGEARRLRPSGLSWREVEGRVAVLDLQTSSFFELNGPGTRLWKRLAEGPATAEELVTLLLSQYDIGENQAAGDVLAFLTSLETADLLDRP